MCSGAVPCVCKPVRKHTSSSLSALIQTIICSDWPKTMQEPWLVQVSAIGCYTSGSKIPCTRLAHFHKLLSSFTQTLVKPKVWCTIFSNTEELCSYCYYALAHPPRAQQSWVFCFFLGHFKKAWKDNEWAVLEQYLKLMSPLKKPGAWNLGSILEVRPACICRWSGQASAGGRDDWWYLELTS